MNGGTVNNHVFILKDYCPPIPFAISVVVEYAMLVMCEFRFFWIASVKHLVNLKNCCLFDITSQV